MNRTSIIIVFTFLFQITLKGSILLTSLYALHLKASPAMLGFIVAVGSLFPMLFASFAGKLADRFRLNWLLCFSMLGAGFTLAVIFFSKDHVGILLIVQLLFGLFQITTVVCSQSTIGAISTAENRAQNFGHYTLGVSIANLIGPGIVGLIIEVANYQIAYLILSLFAIVPAVGFLFLSIKPTQVVDVTNAERLRTIDLLKMPSLRQMLVTSGVILTGVGLFEFYFPIYSTSIGVKPSMIGLLVSLNGLAFIISRLLMGVLQKRWRAEQIIGGCLVVTASAFLVLPFMQSIVGLGVISLITGLGLGCCQPLSIVMAYAVAPKGSNGEVLGLRLTVNKAIQFTVPLVFGSIAFIGTMPIFWLTGMLLGWRSFGLLKGNKTI